MQPEIPHDIPNEPPEALKEKFHAAGYNGPEEEIIRIIRDESRRYDLQELLEGAHKAFDEGRPEHFQALLAASAAFLPQLKKGKNPQWENIQERIILIIEKEPCDGATGEYGCHSFRSSSRQQDRDAAEKAAALLFRGIDPKYRQRFLDENLAFAKEDITIRTFLAVGARPENARAEKLIKQCASDFVHCLTSGYRVNEGYKESKYEVLAFLYEAGVDFHAAAVSAENDALAYETALKERLARKAAPLKEPRAVGKKTALFLIFLEAVLPGTVTTETLEEENKYREEKEKRLELKRQRAEQDEAIEIKSQHRKLEELRRLPADILACKKILQKNPPQASWGKFYNKQIKKGQGKPPQP